MQKNKGKEWWISKLAGIGHSCIEFKRVEEITIEFIEESSTNLNKSSRISSRIWSISKKRTLINCRGHILSDCIIVPTFLSSPVKETSNSGFISLNYQYKYHSKLVKHEPKQEKSCKSSVKAGQPGSN